MYIIFLISQVYFAGVTLGGQVACFVVTHGVDQLEVVSCEEQLKEVGQVDLLCPVSSCLLQSGQHLSTLFYPVREIIVHFFLYFRATSNYSHIFQWMWVVFFKYIGI